MVIEEFAISNCKKCIGNNLEYLDLNIKAESII
uniref:Uncharacterized protein n=1 Tax=Tetranychus urticae TaxID=32264 RepID=T1KV01_TETUR